MCRSPDESRGHTEREKPTLGALFRQAGRAFWGDGKLTQDQRKTAWNLAHCQTGAMGGHLWCCDACGALVSMYNSCRNRNCPQCQNRARYRWVSARVKELLPVPYFHCVFTLPHQLNPLIAANPREMLGTLFKAAAASLFKLSQEPRYLGAKPGILMVLHTWGQKLNCHYHVHCIVTGGGLNTKSEWVSCPSKKYFLPIRPLSEVFRGIYCEAINRMWKRDELVIPNSLSNPIDLKELMHELYHHNWVVYAKRPFGGPSTVLKYLARYTNRTAIANSRILKYENGMVTFSYTDYRKGHKKRLMQLSLVDFLRRFISHVLPSGFMRIRGYGLWANACKKKTLARCRDLLGEPSIPEAQIASAMTLDDQEVTFDESKPEPDYRCPHCQEGTLRFVPEVMVLFIDPPPLLDSS